MKTKICTLFFLSFLLLGCSEQKEKSSLNFHDITSLSVPRTIILKSDIQYNNKTSLWSLKDKPYSGFVVSYHKNDTLKEKFGILNGKKQNKSIEWFSDGHLKNVSNYHLGKLHGEKKMWSSDSTHILIAKFIYFKGKPHGEQKKWYVTGELYKKMNLNQGKEEGIQQAYRKNGVLYANYEAKEGRIFGLKKQPFVMGWRMKKFKIKIKGILFLS